MNREVLDFDKNRIAFMIIKNKIMYLKNTSWSHRQWFETLNLDICFEDIVRGFYYKNRIVFYKGNFIYDDDTIKKANEFYDIIVKDLDLNSPELWCGQTKPKDDSLSQIWEPVKRLK